MTLSYVMNGISDRLDIRGDIILVEVPVPVTEALRNAKELSLSFVNGPLRSGFGNRYRYR